MSGSNLTYLEALGELEELMQQPQVITKAALESLVSRVSVHDPIAGENATTYLYSGGLCSDLKMSKLIASININEGSAARIIDRTAAANFLKSDEYEEALKIAFKNENPELLLPENELLLKNAAANYMYDGKNGPWANRSSAFMEETSGKVECIVPKAKATRVM